MRSRAHHVHPQENNRLLVKSAALMEQLSKWPQHTYSSAPRGAASSASTSPCGGDGGQGDDDLDCDEDWVRAARSGSESGTDDDSSTDAEVLDRVLMHYPETDDGEKVTPDLWHCCDTAPTSLKRSWRTALQVNLTSYMSFPLGLPTALIRWTV